MNTAKGMRLHIGLYGRRNVGKSSLLNALTRQQVSIVSAHAGTTTDPVEKPMELLPLGPVLFIDTAGIDDTGDLGTLRKEKTRACLKRTDLALLTVAENGWGAFEEELFSEFRLFGIPVIVVFNKKDIFEPEGAVIHRLELEKTVTVRLSTVTGEGIGDLRAALVAAAPEEFIRSPRLVSDLVPAGKAAVLVVPIDKEAPKGRLILPQVQTIRELLDNDSLCVVCKERELRAALDNLRVPPALVVTDSQAFLKVAGDVPKPVPMTGFSILFARLKGDLTTMVRNTLAIERLQPGCKVLIAEACTHHPIADDIGRVKIPRWLTQYKGFPVDFITCQGHDFPDDLSSFSLVIHCGGCMHNRREMISRLMLCAQHGVPMTNYGLTIAYTLGIFERALSPFPAAYEAYLDAQGKSRG
jgi:[FeFe] hydrogenase H-cluster maturation GTPase HydF